MKFQLDPDKDAINRRKHQLPLALAIQIFERDYVDEQDIRFDYGEVRFVATGPVRDLNDRICVVVYMWRDSVRRLISFRKANDKEIRKFRRSHG